MGQPHRGPHPSLAQNHVQTTFGAGPPRCEMGKAVPYLAAFHDVTFLFSIANLPYAAAHDWNPSITRIPGSIVHKAVIIAFSLV